MRFETRSKVGVTADELYAWHLRPGALERLLPPWERMEVIERSGPIAEGSRVKLRVKVGLIRLDWLALHYGFEPGRQFRDVQEKGPFARWVHTHRFHPAGSHDSILEDEIEFALPGGLLGRLAAAGFTRRKLERTFRYRHAVTAGDLERHRMAGGRRLRVAIGGASGLIGSALSSFLESGGHDVSRLVRRQGGRQSDIYYDADSGRIEAEKLEGLDAVVHLAGENVAARRWSPEQKARMRDSRVQTTRLVAETLARLKRPPAVLVNASAIGFYGNRGDEILDEGSSSGVGFLAESCREWEAAVAPAERAGMRVVRLRFGVVLAAAGGALAKMLPPFRLGLGGRLGSGQQFMSWIALDDVIGVIHHALLHDELKGPVNVVAPEPVRNAEFTAALARVLRRPAFLPVPAVALRLLLGREMAEELLLSSTRVVPRRLQGAGFQFRHTDLEQALRFELGR